MSGFDNTAFDPSTLNPTAPVDSSLLGLTGTEPSFFTPVDPSIQPALAPDFSNPATTPDASFVGVTFDPATSFSPLPIDGSLQGPGVADPSIFAPPSFDPHLMGPPDYVPPGPDFPALATAATPDENFAAMTSFDASLQGPPSFDPPTDFSDAAASGAGVFDIVRFGEPAAIAAAAFDRATMGPPVFDTSDRDASKSMLAFSIDAADVDVASSGGSASPAAGSADAVPQSGGSNATDQGQGSTTADAELPHIDATPITITLDPGEDEPSDPIRLREDITVVGQPWPDLPEYEALMPDFPYPTYADILAAAEGMGHIEWGDVVQAAKGAYNGVADSYDTASKLAVAGIFAQVVGPINAFTLAKNLPTISIPRATIDLRYGGAAIAGEQLGQNLAAEGVGAALGAAAVLAKAMKMGAAASVAIGEVRTVVIGEAVIEVKYLGMKRVADTADAWTVYQVEATGSEFEHGFRMTWGDKPYVRWVDNIENNFLVEAKLGNMGQLQDAQRKAEIIKQATDYLVINKAFGLNGVRYAVSDPVGVANLVNEFKSEFPQAIASGALSVWLVP